MLDFLSDTPYKKFLSGTNGYFITCYTLGVDVEKYIKKLRFTDLTKMCIADAVASSYLEYLSDLYDKSLGDNLSYRFCPGYQGTSVKDLKEIFKILNISSIGVELLDTYIMVPQKSMVGIIGIGGTKKKTCGNCMLKGKCQYILEGTKCYD